MAAARRCDHCREPYIAKTVRSRYCSNVCRVMAAKSRGSTSATVGVEPAGVASSDIADATLAQLEQAGVEGSPLGQSALLLARRIGAGMDSGSSIAALNREWRMVMAEALACADTGDGIDELRGRRDVKRASASAG